MVEAWCKGLERCPGTFPLGTRERNSCVELGCFLYACEVEHEDLRGQHRDRVVARQPTKSAARREACAAWLATARCDALEAFNPPAFSTAAAVAAPREPTPCDGLLTAVDPRAFGLGAGAQCTAEPCAPGLDCAPPSVNRATAARRCELCRARPGEGEACGALDGGCAPGLTCQSALTTRTCVPLLADGAACAGSAQCNSGACDAVARQCVPRKGAGAACQRGDECASGLCDLGGARTCLPGCRASSDCPEGEWCDWVAHRCRPPLAEGETCLAHAHCQSGFCTPEGRCAPAPGVPGCGQGAGCRPPLECRDNSCQPMALSCRPRTVGESCRALGVCDEVSSCDLKTGLCLPRAPQGAPCDRADGCLAGLACLGGDGGICGAPVAEGGGCWASFECAEGLSCEVEPRSGASLCAAPPTGLPCGKSSACPASHFCSAAGRCALRGVEGQACAVSAPCLEPLYCEQGTVCRAKRDGGESCGPFVGCAAGLRCGDGGTCETAAAVGTPCTPDEGGKCLPNLYCDSFAASPVCAVQLGEAQACTRDAQCASGACEPSFGCLASASCVLER